MIKKAGDFNRFFIVKKVLETYFFMCYNWLNDYVKRFRNVKYSSDSCGTCNARANQLRNTKYWNL